MIHLPYGTRVRVSSGAVLGLVLAGMIGAAGRLKAFQQEAGTAHGQGPAATHGPEDAAAGKRVYTNSCAVCHDRGLEQAPTRSALGNYTKASIVEALTTGKMRPMAAGLSAQDIQSVAYYLTSSASMGSHARLAAPDSRANLCHDVRPMLEVSPSDWNGWSPDAENTRFHAGTQLNASNIGSLQPAWTFAYPGARAYGPPSVAGGRVFVGGSTGEVFALDATTGCTYWSTPKGPAVHTSVLIGGMTDAKTRQKELVAYYGDTAGTVHAVNAATGAPLWTAKPETHAYAGITGSFKLVQGRLYVPFMTVNEGGAATDSKYPCCSLRGSVAALDAESGRVLWHSYTIPQTPQVYGVKANGVSKLGPAGASVWSAPTVDSDRQRVYVGSGNSRTNKLEDGSDAILAYDLSSGKRLWSFQATHGDAWLGACEGASPHENCPSPLGPDVDFGSPPVLKSLPDGRRILLAAQKSGMVYALDAGKQGQVLWKRNLAADAHLPTDRVIRDRDNPGVVFGMAADDSSLYAAIADPSKVAGHIPLGVYALDLLTGNIVWHAPGAAIPSCSWGASGCTGAQRVAVTAIPGVVIAGSANGHVYAYDAKTGKVLWNFNTAQPFAAVNGVTAQGGAVEGSSTVVAGSQLFVMSGYASYGGGEGDALIAFHTSGQP